MDLTAIPCAHVQAKLKAQKIAAKSYRDRIDEFNAKIATISGVVQIPPPHRQSYGWQLPHHNVVRSMMSIPLTYCYVIF